MLSLDAKKAGENAAKYSINKQKKVTLKYGKKPLNVHAGVGVRYVIPQQISECGKIHFTLRAVKPGGITMLRLMAGKQELLKKKLPWVNPVSMISVDAHIPAEILNSFDNIEVTISDN
jgi:hypothetical protein